MSVEIKLLGPPRVTVGEVQRLLGRFDLAAEHFERVLESHPQPVEIYADWALVAHGLGDAPPSRQLGEKALAAVEVKAHSASSRARNVNGAIATGWDQAIAHLDRALELADGDDVARMAALNNRAYVLADAGEDDAAVELVSHAIDLASRTGHRHHEATLRDFLADLYHRSGEEQLSGEAQTRAIRLFADLGTDNLEPELWLFSRW